MSRLLGLIDGTVANLWKPVHATVGWSIWLVEDAPAPGDPDAELVERMARAIDAEPGFNVSDMADLTADEGRKVIDALAQDAHKGGEQE